HNSALALRILQDIRRFGKPFVPALAHLSRSYPGKPKATANIRVPPQPKGGDAAWESGKRV
ncbi:MAG: hypothetical protein ABSD72_12655, partial [Terracidiphilus sp.]